MPVAANNDAELVTGTLTGNRDAFSQIVSRYQSLICSLTYSATGNLGQSEDLAQETFITAWKHLVHLRERDKLRSWLCGIARNRINNFLRREGREPLHKAGLLDEISETHSLEPLPAEQAISNEEAAILWRSLERIPEIYREPLVLFYREHQSIETVAQNLDLSEDAVKQRLSRGRKLLHEQVLAFVEGALERTNPGKFFTIGVLAALPTAMATSAKAVTLVAAAKGGAGMKVAGTMGLLGVLLSPLMILFGNFIPYRIGLAEARTDEERRHLKSYFGKIWAWSFALSFVPLTVFWLTLENHQPGSVKTLDALMLWFLSFIVVYLLTVISFGAVTARQRREYLSKILVTEHGGVMPKPAWEFCTRIKFLGLPLVHICIGDRFDVLKKPVRAWIALGNVAFGGLFAFGGVAIAPLSIGGVSVGLLPIGGFTLGVVAIGGLAFGGWTAGAIAVGWQSMGACAVAWHAAAGTFALAHDFAVGTIANALQVNNAVAKNFFAMDNFLRCIETLNRHWFWFNLLWITPLFVQWQVITRKNKSAHVGKNEIGASQ
ncbi:MAG: sigma-70 family RNA polymerase sigma factor [Verrucomicrobiota bacterium]|jgi:RNA polymerase sigma factor (sigma-70 family)